MASRPRAVLHVGLPKTGTSFLQASLVRHEAALTRAGVALPHRDGVMVRAALDVRGEHDGFGLDPEQVRGTFDRLAEQARRAGREHRTHTVLSHELLAAAGTTDARDALDRLHPLEVHVVVTARDPARQALAEWQEGVKHGRRLGFEKFARTVLPMDSDKLHAQRFRAAQDLTGVLERWGSTLPPERVHVVTCPPRGTDPAVLWERFGQALGLDVAGWEPAEKEHRNSSLGACEVALLRQVNKALDGALDRPAYGRAVKQVYAQRVLVGLDSPRPVLPATLIDPLRERAERWVKQIDAAGWTVHGDPADLLPVPGDLGAPHPDEVGADALLRSAVAGTAGLIHALSEQQQRVAELEHEVERLARKRRKLRHRLDKLSDRAH